MKHYTETELENFAPIIEAAKTLAAEDRWANRDEGTCVLGNGIEVMILQPRCKNPRRRLVIPGPFQGNVGNYKTLKRALQYMQEKGIECRYQDGCMD